MLGATLSRQTLSNWVIGTATELQDIYDLIQLVKIKVKGKYGIDLKEEIKFLGEFR